MRTTTKTQTSNSDLDLHILTQAASYLSSATSVHREGSTTQAYIMAESAANYLLSYLSRTSLKLGIKPRIPKLIDELTARN